MARTNSNSSGGGGNVSGSGNPGEVAFWDGVNSITGSSFFTYDQATGNLLVIDGNGAILQVLPNVDQVVVGRPVLTAINLNSSTATATHNSRIYDFNGWLADGGSKSIMHLEVPNLVAKIGDVNDLYSQVKINVEPLNSAISFYGLGNFVPSAVTFTGGGLNDLTYNATNFSGMVTTNYTVTIASTGGTDTFDWFDDQGNSGTGVPCAVTPTNLANGVTVTFGAVTGHTITDEWTFSMTVTRGSMMEFNGTNAFNSVTWGDINGINNNTLMTLSDKLKTITFTADGWTTNSAEIPLTATVPVSAAELATLGSVPVTLIPAPGVGKYISISEVSCKYNYGTTGYGFAGAPSINVGGTAFFNPVAIDSLGILSQNNSFIGTFDLQGGEFAENAPAQLTDFAGDPGVVGDGTVILNITYTIKSF